MIIGIGSDLIDIRRIEKTLARFGPRFIARVFTANEQARSERRAGIGHARVASYAKRFAAKEACAKALGTGLRQGVFWRDMGVVNLRTGAPSMVLTHGAKARLDSLTPYNMQAQINVTISDDFPLAHAVILISATPRDPVQSKAK